EVRDPERLGHVPGVGRIVARCSRRRRRRYAGGRWPDGHDRHDAVVGRIGHDAHNDAGLAEPDHPGAGRPCARWRDPDADQVIDPLVGTISTLPAVGQTVTGSVTGTAGGTTVTTIRSTVGGAVGGVGLK